MADPNVFHVGQIQDAAGMLLDVGVDYNTVEIAVGSKAVCLELPQLEEFAQMLVHASWQAARAAERLEQDSDDAA